MRQSRAERATQVRPVPITLRVSGAVWYMTICTCRRWLAEEWLARDRHDAPRNSATAAMPPPPRYCLDFAPTGSKRAGGILMWQLRVTPAKRSCGAPARRQRSRRSAGALMIADGTGPLRLAVAVFAVAAAAALPARPCPLPESPDVHRSKPA